LFGFILFMAVTVMHFYVFWRASSVPFLRRRVPLKALVGSGVILWTVFCIGRFTGHNAIGATAATIELAGMDWMGALFLYTVCMLAVDGVTGFGLFMPRMAPSLRGLGLILGGLLSAIAAFQGGRPPVVHEYEVSIPGLPADMDGMVVVGVSDLHIGMLIGSHWLKDLIAQIQEQKPDMVVLLGDVFEGRGLPPQGLIEDLKHLSAPLGVWAVLGNHEYHGREASSVDPFNGTDIKVLRNSWREIRPGLVLAGIDDLTAIHRSGRSSDAMTDMLADRPAGATILLSHTPWQTGKAAAAGVGLMLSGHTHGGQIWPFGYLVQGRYPLLAGLYRVDGMPVIVSRGAGTWGPRMRLWLPGEILRVTLKAAGSAKVLSVPRMVHPVMRALQEIICRQIKQEHALPAENAIEFL
jgi:predicted MPP superfamily phosphohydrolase